MKKARDHFSKQSAVYKKYRPTYPLELYKGLLRLTNDRDACWDCGTGNGQVAIALSNHFKKVYASDISQNQIAYANQKDNIVYSVERAEKTRFESDKFDLITVAQAIHWFDFEAFHQEARRVSKNGAILAVWGYGLLRLASSIDALINEFYREVVGPYWNEERSHIDQAYRSIPFPLKEIGMGNYNITALWTVGDLEGYLNSWSSVQNYLKVNAGNPVSTLIEQIIPLWDTNAIKEVRFPIFTRVGRIEK